MTTPDARCVECRQPARAARRCPDCREPVHQRCQTGPASPSGPASPRWPPSRGPVGALSRGADPPGRLGARIGSLTAWGCARLSAWWSRSLMRARRIPIPTETRGPPPHDAPERRRTPWRVRLERLRLRAPGVGRRRPRSTVRSPAAMSQGTPCGAAFALAGQRIDQIPGAPRRDRRDVGAPRRTRPAARDGTVQSAVPGRPPSDEPLSIHQELWMLSWFVERLVTIPRGLPGARGGRSGGASSGTCGPCARSGSPSRPGASPRLGGRDSRALKQGQRDPSAP